MPQKNQTNSKYTTVKISIETAKSLRHKHIDTGEQVQDLADRAIKFFVACGFPDELSPKGYNAVREYLEENMENGSLCTPSR